eukprot:279540_1
MASDSQPSQEPNTWDSDVDVSSEDEEKTEPKQPPKTSPPPSPDTTKHADPQHLRLSLLDSYTESPMYSKIRKRRIQSKLKTEHKEEIEQVNPNTKHKPATIFDLKTHRILYEMNSFESKWIWIDSLPTDDSNDHEWIHQYSNLNLFASNTDAQTPTPIMDIDTVDRSHVSRMGISEFESLVNEARKSVINSPLYPSLGCCGYVKEFYVTLCDWNTEGVLAIKYMSDEANRSRKESQSLETCHGYWQRLRYQLSASPNGKYIAVLFDRYCVIRSDTNQFCDDVCRIALPISFWEFTQMRRMAWSGENELLAIASHNAHIVILDDKCDEIVAFKCDEDEAHLSGLVWRKLKSTNGNKSYGLQLIIMFENGRLHYRSLQVDSVTLQVIDFEQTTRTTSVQFPHSSVRKWIYDGIDCYECGNESYVAISCIPCKLLDTAPRQTRLGSGLMLLQFESECDLIVIKHYNSRIPSNSYFKVDSVCFTMADRRCKLRGRRVSISADGKHILCVDLRGNMELFEYDAGQPLELCGKMSNTREMSYGSYPSHSRIFDMEWYDDTSIIIVFANNTFCITPIISIKHYTQREMKWSLNYLGTQREQLYGLPIISRGVAKTSEDSDTADARMFFILEISEAYLQRTADEHLKYIEEPSNDIDRKQNEMYGYRKYRKISLSTFSSITPLQLFKQYLNQNEYDKALQIANKFKLDTDSAYQSQFDYLIHQYNETHQNENTTNNNDAGNTTSNTVNDLTQILSNIGDELWIVDHVLNVVSLCDLSIMNGVLAYVMEMVQHSQRLRDARPNAYDRCLQYRERVMTLIHIANETHDFEICQFVDRPMDAHKGSNYLVFRDANIVDIAYNLASNASLFALRTIFTYHWHEISVSDRLRILCFIPFTVDPRSYDALLPAITAPVWSNTNRWHATEFGLSIVDECSVNADDIIAWYKTRIYDIEDATGNVEYSLILCNMAVSRLQIDALQGLLESLLLFHKIMYEYHIIMDQISIRRFETMDATDKLLFVLKDSNYETIIADIEQRSPYFVDEKYLASSLLAICAPLSAQYGKIDLVAAILSSDDKYSLKEQMTDGVSLIEFGLSNALKCTSADMDAWNGLQQLSRVLKGMDDADDEKLSHFEALMKSGSVLCQTYNIERSLLFYETLVTIGHATHEDDIDAEACGNWKAILNVSNYNYHAHDMHGLAVDIMRDLLSGIHRCARAFGSDEQWNALRSDLLRFCKDIFSFIDAQTMQFEFYRIVFKCCAFDFIAHDQKTNSELISHEDLIQLSLSTATELIDCSSLSLAQRCLAFIPSKYEACASAVWRLRDLIFAVQLLCDAFEYEDVAPFQLRKIFETKSKHFTAAQFDFICNVLRSNAPEHYVRTDDFVQFLEYLSFAEDAYKVEMLCICADFALQQKDELFAYNIYGQIFANYKVSGMGSHIEQLLWNICRKLMRYSSDKRFNQFELLSHSLTTSSPNKMHKILTEWQAISRSIAIANDDLDCAPPYARMSPSNIRQQVEMNEMQKLVNVYFECDPDMLINLNNDEIYAFLSKSNEYWNELEMLSAALPRTYTHKSMKHFEQLIGCMIDHQYLCDEMYLITFLLLTDNVADVYQSFVDVLSHKNIPMYKKSKIAQIAAQYFVFQSINKLMDDEQYNAMIALCQSIDPQQIFLDQNHQNMKEMIQNITKIIPSNQKQTPLAKCCKNANYFYNKCNKFQQTDSI